MTPISAIGAKRAAGFTLVELLIVLAILAAAAATVVLTLPDARGQLRRQAERFAARLQHAEQEAVLTNRRIAVRVDAKGYGFRVQHAGQWQPLEAPGLESAVWDADVAPVFQQESALTARFDPAGLAEPMRLVLTLEGERVAVVLEPSGKIKVENETGP